MTQRSTPRSPQTARTNARNADRSVQRRRAQDLRGRRNGILADAFALYLKTKNFHWHISGPHFRDYHLMLDEQAEQIFATTDDIAERVRKIGGTTLRSIGDIAQLQSIKDNDEDFVAPLDMLRELRRRQQGVIASPCARRTSFATSTTTSPPPACWKSGSTRPRSAPGSCSRPRATPIARGINESHHPRPMVIHGRITRGYVLDLGAEGLPDNAAPAGFEGAEHIDLFVGGWRAGQPERVGRADAEKVGLKISHIR